MPRVALDEGLADYLPLDTLPLIRRWLEPHNCAVVLSRPRKSKLGDFRRPRRGSSALITVNRDLSPFRFVITLTHEIAHLYVWAAHRRRRPPHGREWKACFAGLLRDLASVESLPSDFRDALLAHAERPLSTAQRDLRLWASLRELEGGDECVLDSLPVGASFGFRGRRFEKVRSARTRCVCRDRKTGRDYYIPKMAAVDPE